MRQLQLDWLATAGIWRLPLAPPYAALPEDKSNDSDWLRDRLIESGAKTKAVKIDVSLPENPSLIFNSLEQDMGPVTAIIHSHCHDVPGDIIGTKVEEFDLHFCVKTKASWLLVREFGLRFKGPEAHRPIV